MIRFRMFRITVDEFAILKDNPPIGNNLSLNTQIRFKYSIDTRDIAPEILFSFIADNEKFMVLKLTCEFEVHPEDWKSFIKGKEFLIPKSILEYFAVHTVGTARGIMYCKTEGTPFNQFIIPPINVSELIKEDLAVKIEA